MSSTVATTIVDLLERHGITRGYCVPGESYLAVLDALYSSDISTITCRQEGGAAYMAMAEGRLTGVPGLLLVTRGPGPANAMIGIHCAYEEGVAMVVLVGLPPLSSRGARAFQEFEFQQWFNATAKSVVVIDEPRHATAAVDTALATARAGRPGPVIIGLPEDVLIAEVPERSWPAIERNFPAIEQTSSMLSAVMGEAAMAAARPEVDAVERLVSEAKRPLIVVGDGIDEEGSRRLTTFASAHQVPLVADFRTYGQVDNSSDCFVGALGVGKGWNVTEWAAEADLLVYLGCVRSDINSDHLSPAFDRPTVVVGPPELLPFHCGRLDLLVDISPDALCCALSGNPPAAARGTARSEWLRRGRAAYEQSTDAAAAAAPGERLAAYRTSALLAGAIRDVLPADTIITYGAGSFTGVPQTLLPATCHRGALGTRNGSMGFGVPAAVAAKLARPNAAVIAFSGDGDFLMNGQELATAKRCGAGIVVVVVDNGRLGTIRNHQEREFPGRVSGTDLVNPDFESYATAFGFRYHTAEEVIEDPQLFADVLRADVPTLVHAHERAAS
ncbi:thiamine pyrophosphate-dependent enzyme [Brevibacterium daeguense]|nr:thiamine pyrophosphate-dependent enzyme [Brevibacterium daeguense]